MARPSAHCCLGLAFLCLAMLAVCAAAAPQRGNVAAIGNGDINGFLSDRNLVMMQINCVKGTGPCNRLGAQLKQAIPEVLNNKCGRCTQTQAQNARKLIDYVKRNYPADYQQITARYLRSG